MKRIIIFDTTLRDGEQSPGVSLNVEEKLQIARQLQKMGVDVIEAGFPAASKGDFKSVKRIAEEIRGVQIAVLARAKKGDIDRAWEAIKDGSNPRLHIFLATSDIHLKHKLGITREEALNLIKEAISYARQYTSNIEFSAEDASRSDLNFVCQAFAVAIEAGATTLNFPDTVGYATPDDFAKMIRYILEHIPNIHKAILSVHCHNDLGLATANTLAALKAGAQQVECTINGIGERAGNTALEELIMAIYIRQDNFPFSVNIEKKYIAPISRLVSRLTGMIIQPNKAIVGGNAYLHESGVHQDGILKEKSTYQIIDPKTIGADGENIIFLGKHSGRKAVAEKLEQMGYHLGSEELDRVFKKLKELSDKKGEVHKYDLEAIVVEEVFRIPDKFSLLSLQVIGGKSVKPTATISIKKNNKEICGTITGCGSIDAIFKAIKDITGVKCELSHFAIDSITDGTDAQANVICLLKSDNGIVVTGQGSDIDVLTASAKAFINALNKIEKLKECSF